MAKNFWYHKNPKMTRSRIAVSKPLYDSLKELFAEVTARIRRPDQEVIVVDGISYYFMYGDTGANLRVGYTNSPDPGRIKVSVVLSSLTHFSNVISCQITPCPCGSYRLQTAYEHVAAPIPAKNSVKILLCLCDSVISFSIF
jgi:hypothetical protein